MNEFDIHFNGRPDDLLGTSGALLANVPVRERKGTRRDIDLARDRVDAPHCKRAVAEGVISGETSSLTGTGGGAQISPMIEHVLDLVEGQRQ